jgi:nucleotide-binding universal stress UspA family protein
MLHFAYDGSINGDWVSHYAIRLASHCADRTLRLIHIREASTSAGDLETKLHRIGRECQRAEVALDARIETLRRNVLDSLDSLVPPGPESYVVCGTRGRPRKRAMLSGTISEQLLRDGRRNVLAIHVVQPGLLGLPRSLLLPVSGHPRGFRSGIPFLKLFAPDVTRIHILFVAQVARWRFRVLSQQAAERLTRRGHAYIARVEREIDEQLQLGRSVTDVNVAVSDDVPKEIIVFTNRVKTRLIYMGASERSLRERFFYGNPIEQVLRNTTCDVAIYRGVE